MRGQWRQGGKASKVKRTKVVCKTMNEKQTTECSRLIPATPDIINLLDLRSYVTIIIQ